MKGQAAWEFLMTYGWAVIIVVVVVAALFAMNIFNPSAFEPNKVVICYEYFGGVKEGCNVSCECEFKCLDVSTDDYYEITS